MNDTSLHALFSGGSPSEDSFMQYAWTVLQRGTESAKAPFHLMNFTYCNNEEPFCVTVVLRFFDPTKRILAFHTDHRSLKVASLEHNPNVCVLGYDPASKLQIQCHGKAVIQKNGPRAENAWINTTLHSRRCYLVKNLGDVSRGDALYDTEDLKKRCPTLEESEKGRKNFSVVDCCFDRISLLYLCSSGHRKLRARWAGSHWLAEWIIA